MKIGIVGIGAMGSVYAGLFAAAGHEVWGVDRDEAHVAAIRDHGLQVEGASGSRLVHIKASTDADKVGPCDLVIVATKAAGVVAAGRAAGLMLGPDTPVLTIQNGMGSPERLAEVLDAERILVGVAGGFGASLSAPGRVHHNGMELVRIGEYHGGTSSRLDAVVDTWCGAGFNARAYADINQLVWEKFICNVTFSASCTVLRSTVGQVMANPHAWPIALGCGLEAYAVGLARDVRFGFDDVEHYIHDFGTRIPDARPSMLQDHLAGRRSEIDAINGQVVDMGIALGMSTPLNGTLSSLVRALETGFA